MALFDLTSGWTAWAPFTFIIVGVMGFVYGLVAGKKPTLLKLLFATVLVLIVKVGGYYVAEALIYGNWVAPAASISGNVVQILTGAVVAIPVIIGGEKCIN